MLGLSPYAESIFTTGGIYAIAALGLYLTLLSGQFSVAHAALMGMGGYASAVVAVKLGWGLVPSLAAGAVVGGALGLVLGTVLRRMTGLQLGIATVAIGQAIALTVSNVEALGGALGYPGIPLRATLGIVLVTLVLTLVLLAVLRRTTFGLALMATGKDETVCAALGISTLSMRLWAFGLGGALAGVGGGLLGQYVGLVEPNSLAFAAEVQLFIFVIVGGVTTPWGAVLGAVGITWLLELLRFSTTDRFWILGLLLTVVVLVRPQGLLQRRSLLLEPEHGRLVQLIPLVQVRRDRS